MVDQLTVEGRLALLLQAEDGVDTGARLPRHDALQKLDPGRGHLHVDHEIDAGQAEQEPDEPTVEQHRVQVQAPVGATQHRNSERVLLVAVDDAPDHVGGLVAIERKTIEDGVHTYDIFRDGVSKQKVGAKEFAQAVVARLRQKPTQLNVVSYGEGPKRPLTNRPPYKRSTAKHELVGADAVVH